MRHRKGHLYQTLDPVVSVSHMLSKRFHSIVPRCLEKYNVETNKRKSITLRIKIFTLHCYNETTNSYSTGKDLRLKYIH